MSASDVDNPIAVCDVQATQTQTYLADGTNSPGTSTNPLLQTAIQYNSYGQETQSTTTGDDLGSTPTTVSKSAYIYNDNITTGTTSATGTYIVDRVAASTVDDGSGNYKACAFNHYDGSTTTPVPTGQQSSLTKGHATQVDRYATTCTSTGGTGIVSTSATYDTTTTKTGNPLNVIDADANGGISGHTATTGSCTGYTACTAYESTFDALPASSINALNQTASIQYTTAQAAYGYGLWPSSTTDVNGQVTSMAYDTLGRTLSTTLPGEGTGLTTTQMAYSPTSSCPTTGASSPCLEVDTIQRLDSVHTLTVRHFYDGWGNEVETRKPAFYGSNDDVVQYSMYDVMGRLIYQSMPYFVAAYTGSQMGTAAYSTPNTTQTGTSYTYDGLGRTLMVTDPDSIVVNITSYAPVCLSGTCYEKTLVIDGDGNQSDTYTDALGRVIQADDLDSSGTLYRTYKYGYDYLGRRVSTTYADGSHTASVTYDLLGRQTAVSDPDLGNWTYSYDPNGNETSSVDPRGLSGTIYLGFDGLNRHIWTSTSSDGSSPLASYTYDTGTNSIGRLSEETFVSGPSQSVTGSYQYSYDTRGRVTQDQMTIAGASQTFSFGYNDANQQTTTTYGDGSLLTTAFDINDWLNNMSLNHNSITTSLLDTLTYQAEPGASALPTQANFGGDTYVWEATYDPDLRLWSDQADQISSPSTQYVAEAIFYDNAGNVTTRSTTMPQGSVSEDYCYDAVYHLIWAGSNGTVPQSCGGGTITSSFAPYAQSFSYDTLDRITSGPAGSYTYGDSSHLDGVTSTSGGFSASYDAAGEETCRAPTSSQTCSGTPTGQQLTYDALNRLIAWQNAPSNPTSTAYDAYDGEGHRVWQQTSSGGTTTTSYYGGLMEVSSNGTTTTTTDYYACEPITTVSVNGTLSYLVLNSLGSISVALDGSGNEEAATLYAPYGGRPLQHRDDAHRQGLHRPIWRCRDRTGLSERSVL